jgi:S1-C subfamily serine protease
MRRTLAIVLAAAVTGALAGALIGVALDHNGTSVSSAAPIPAPPPGRLASSISLAADGLTPEEIYTRDAPAVVVITATQTEQVPPTFFTPPTTEQVSSLGSGFVVDDQGDIVTNDHVVAGATRVRVGFTGGATYSATVVGTDPSTDVAVVRVNAPASALHPVAFGDSSQIEVGDPVYAIGNPFGLDRTMTAGIVSAVGRDIQAPNGLSIPNAIQTDAPINHGNSGGPLIDRFGRVIGITAQIEGGTVDANVGIGFAIPSATAGSVSQQLIATGRAEHAWLGIQVETIQPGLARTVRGLPARGVVVARVVAGSPAAKAGLKAGTRSVTVNGISTLLGGDAIVTVAGKPVDTAAQIADAVAVRKPGDKLALEVFRDGASRKVEVTLGNVPGRT